MQDGGGSECAGGCGFQGLVGAAENHVLAATSGAMESVALTVTTMLVMVFVVDMESTLTEASAANRASHTTQMESAVLITQPTWVGSAAIVTLNTTLMVSAAASTNTTVMACVVLEVSIIAMASAAQVEPQTKEACVALQDWSTATEFVACPILRLALGVFAALETTIIQKASVAQLERLTLTTTASEMHAIVRPPGQPCDLGKEKNPPEKGVCCPIGESYVGREKCCREGWDLKEDLCCPPNHINSEGKCCPVGKIKKGNICCEPHKEEKSGICCSNSEVNSNGHCCPQGHHFGVGASRCCPIGQNDSHGKCCPAGEVKKGNICCPINKENKDGICCASDQHNSNGWCCPLNHNYSNGICCPNGLQNSNGLCCKPEEQRQGNICCSKDLTNKGGICCLPSQINSNNKCCEQGEHWDSGRCCKKDLFNKDGICCKKDEINSGGHCCPQNTTYDNGLCCPSGTRNHNNKCCPTNEFNKGGICCSINLENREGKCCSASCGSCNPEEPYKCLSCSADKTLRGTSCCKPDQLLGQNGECFDSTNCPPKTWPDQTEKKCQPCGQHCDRCFIFGNNECFQCSASPANLVVEDGKCECKEGYFMNSENNECLKCHNSCRKCVGTAENMCISCPARAFAISFIPNDDQSKTGICLDCALDENQNDERCSSWLAAPLSADSASGSDGRVISVVAVPANSLKNKYESAKPKRMLYYNYMTIRFVYEVIDIIEAMGDSFDLTKLYHIMMDSESKLNLDYDIKTRVTEDRTGIEVYFYFKDKAKLEKARIEVTMNVKDPDYLVKGLQKLQEEDKNKKKSPNNRLRRIRLLQSGSFTKSHRRQVKDMTPQKIKDQQIKGVIIIQNKTEAERDSLAGIAGKVFFWLMAISIAAYTVSLIFSLFQKDGENSFFVGKRLDSLFFIQFMVKLPLVNARLNPATAAFMDQIYKLDSMLFLNIISETTVMRKEISTTSKFYEYGVPVRVINSAPIVIGGMGFIPILMLIIKRMEKKNVSERARGILRRLTSFLAVMTVPDAFFYSLFSILHSPSFFSLWNLVVVVALTIGVYYLSKSLYKSWETRSSRYEVILLENKWINCFGIQKSQVVFSFIASFSQPIRFCVFSLIVSMSSVSDTKTIGQLIILQMIFIGIAIMFNCCANRKGCLSLFGSMIRELIFFFALLSIEAINSLSEKETSDKLWEITVYTCLMFFLTLMVFVVFPDTYDFILHLSWTKKRSRVQGQKIQAVKQTNHGALKPIDFQEEQCGEPGVVETETETIHQDKDLKDQVDLQTGEQAVQDKIDSSFESIDEYANRVSSEQVGKKQEKPDCHKMDDSVYEPYSTSRGLLSSRKTIKKEKNLNKKQEESTTIMKKLSSTANQDCTTNVKKRIDFSSPQKIQVVESSKGKQAGGFDLNLKISKKTAQKKVLNLDPVR